VATDLEKAALENKYFPTFTTKVLPEMLGEMLGSVKFKLSQKLAELDKNMDLALIRKQQLQYLVAYSPNRLRR
jgi:hypothetical protein